MKYLLLLNKNLLKERDYKYFCILLLCLLLFLLLDKGIILSSGVECLGSYLGFNKVNITKISEAIIKIFSFFFIIYLSAKLYFYNIQYSMEYIALRMNKYKWIFLSILNICLIVFFIRLFLVLLVFSIFIFWGVKVSVLYFFKIMILDLVLYELIALLTFFLLNIVYTSKILIKTFIILIFMILIFKDIEFEYIFIMIISFIILFILNIKFFSPFLIYSNK